MAETLIFSTGSRIISGTLTSTASISQLNLDGVSGSFTGTFIGDGSGVTGVVSASHALQADNAKTADSATSATSASHALRADVADSGTGSFTGSFVGEFTGSNSFTGSLTGGVAVLSSGSGKAWGPSIGSDVGGVFNANSFSLSELAARFGALVDELLVFVPPLLTLPATESLTLYYDATQQGDTSIIEEIINAQNMRRINSGTFTYRTGPPSVDMVSGTSARDPFITSSLIRANLDGVGTMMLLMKPEDVNTTQFVINTGEFNDGKNNIRLGATDGFWGWFGTQDPDDPAANTEMPATISVWQTVCYTVDVDGPAKQNGYLNGALSIGPLSKSFDIEETSTFVDIGHLTELAPFTGSFGAYLQWTTVLTAAEVAEAHNFLRAIDSAYGLPKAL